MIKRLLLCLALLTGANAAEIRPEGGAINRARISYTATYDTDAQDYFTRVEAAGGTVSTPTRVAVNAFVVSAKANGYWEKLTRINLFCGDNLSAALVPLKVGGGSSTDTNVNFVAGDYSEATGLAGNGSTKHLDTGLAANALTASDTHFAIYNRTSGATGGGSNGAGSASFAFYAPNSDGTVYSDQYNAGAGRLSVAITGVAGFLVGTRTAATTHVIYRNGSSIANNSGSGGTLTETKTITIFARNDTAVAGYTSHNFAGYSVGSGLTGANAASYNTDLETFQDALGRGVQ